MRAEHLSDVFESVVAGIATASLYPDGAEWEGYIVYKYENVVDIDSLLLFSVAHGVAAKVHIGRRLQ